jgi:hypothetical protein
MIMLILGLPTEKSHFLGKGLMVLGQNIFWDFLSLFPLIPMGIRVQVSW